MRLVPRQPVQDNVPATPVRRGSLSRRQREAVDDAMVAMVQIEGLTRAAGYAMARLDELNFRREYYSRAAADEGQKVSLTRTQVIATLGTECILQSMVDGFVEGRAR